MHISENNLLISIPKVINAITFFTISYRFLLSFEVNAAFNITFNSFISPFFELSKYFVGTY